MTSAARDELLVARLAGDPEAFSSLLEPLLAGACRLASLMLDGRSDAEDVVQEAALKAWRNLGQLRGGEAQLRPWFLAIVANECRQVRRGRWWSVLKLGELPERGVSSQEDRLVQGGDLRTALGTLRREQRLALFLYFYLDLPLVEVARVLGCSPGAAKVRIHRAVRELRPRLALEEGLP
jgi:RNA polymerase sigma-70 factor (ECF subfamily)